MAREFLIGRLTFFVITIVLSAAFPLSVGQNIITTVAGTDVYFQGEGRPGAGIPLGRDSFVAVDPQGRAVFSDSYFNLIVRVESNGTLHVIGGNNVQGLSPGIQGFAQSGGGYSGDGGPATSAALNRPQGVVYDSQGNLYIADGMNNRIRMINPQGIITTLAGSSQAGYQDGPALLARFDFPEEIAVDSSGAVYVHDSTNYRIRKIYQGQVTTIAGNGSVGTAPENAIAKSSPLNFVQGIAIDTPGNVYVTEFAGYRVAKITPDGHIVTFAGTGQDGPLGDGGPALRASLNGPTGLTFDGTGSLYVTDLNHRLIRKIAAGVITSIAGNGQLGFSGDGGPPLHASFHNPFGLAAPASGNINIYVADRDNFRIRRIDASQTITTIAGNGRLLNSQDGSPAIFEPLLDPFGISMDTSRNLLIADTDNNIVRRMDLSGGMFALAGNGAQEWGGDNSPPTQAGLDSPFAVNVDPFGGFLIADGGNSDIRRVLNGTIGTFAGNGYFDNYGDGGPATQAALNLPLQAVMDANQNTYIADYNNDEIRIVTRDGKIDVFKASVAGPFGLALDDAGTLYVTEYDAGRVTKILPGGASITIAGGGTLAGPNADGHPATTAKLLRPAGIAVDASRNVYFADQADHRVRKVSPGGIISTVAGTGQAGYAGDGGLATNASLHNPSGVAVDNTSGTIYIADTLNNRIRAVQTIAPALSVSPSSVTLTANQAGAISDVATVDVKASSFGHLAGMLFTASASKPWISVSPTVGVTPATLQITVDPSGLIARTYSETVTINAPGANPPALTVVIAGTINAPPPPNLSVDTAVINAGLNAGGQPLIRQFRVLNSGGQQPQVSSVVTMQSGIAWLSVSPTTGVSSANAPAIFNVTITPGNLQTGAYTGQIVLTSGGKQVGAVPVNVVVNAKPGKLLLSSNALNFTALKGGGAPLPKAIDIVNAGTGSLAWKATGASLTANTPNWLSLDTASGSLDTPQTSVATVNASLNPSALGIGTYYGQIQITSDSAANSPQFVTVVLNVVDPASNPGPDVSATALVFPGVQGVNPSSQTITISNLGSQSLNYGSTRLSEDGDWIIHVPSDASIAAGQTSKIVVQPDFTRLGAGTHRGAITLRFSDTTVRTIDVLSIVAPGASTLGTGPALSARALSSRAASPCATDPSHAFVVEVMSPTQSYSILANQATPIQATVRDCNGNAALNSSTVLAYFNVTSGLPTLTMKNGSGAVWTADWTPANPAKNVTLAIGATFAAAGGRAQSGTSLDITGNITARSNAPTANALANAASFVAQSPVAPGAFVTIFGTNLANTTASATAVPLKSSLAGATVTLAGRPLPILYASDTQINAQVPYDLPMFSQQQLSVRRDDSLSPQLDFVVGRAQPAIYTATARGTGQGVIVFANTATYADVSQPAKSGDFLTIYCNGLGPVQGNVDAGTPVTVATSTIDAGTVTIGGVNAPVLYAGLTPGIPGLYQINVQVPTGVSPGNTVPVAITISGQTSPDGVTIALR